MSLFEIPVLEKPVTATIEIPGSKSYTNRALVMAALTKGPVTLYNPLYSEDTEAMIGCLKTMGLPFSSDLLLSTGWFSSRSLSAYFLFSISTRNTFDFVRPPSNGLNYDVNKENSIFCI